MQRIVGLAIGTLLLTGAVASGELTVGDVAPDFELQGTDGRTHRLSDLQGATVVLAWFPKAFTSG